MNDEPLAQIEREILGWDGVFKKRDEHGPGGIPVTSYGFEGREIGHVHHGGANGFLADFRFSKEIRDELIRTGQAIPHPAFSDSRTTASYRIWSTEDVAGALELFRMNYERRKRRNGLV